MKDIPDFCYHCYSNISVARCSSMIRAFAHSVMGHLIDPS